MDVALYEHRRQIALSQLDAFIDVASAWRGSHEDDDWNAGIGWISDVIGETVDYELGGHLCDRQNVAALAWQIDNGVWRFGSLNKDYAWPMTRKQFRRLARRNGVLLPSRHATLWIAEVPARQQEIVELIGDIRRWWRWFKAEFRTRRDSNANFSAAMRTVNLLKMLRGSLTTKINRLPSC